MKKLKDMNLRLGDRICFSDGIVILYDDYFSKDDEIYEGNVLKIERPVKYETIYEAPKQILDKEEKAYLEAVIRPFRDRVIRIEKNNGFDYEWISIDLESIGYSIETDDFCLPSFPKDTMYKGMELNKEYTLDELGLFQGVKNDNQPTD